MPRRRLPLLLAALAGLVAAACSASAAEDPPATTAAPTTTTVPETTTTTEPPVLWPLTGLPAEDPLATGRPAVSVKVDNAPEARPQPGIELADVVYEMRVEGITRLAAVYHSTDANPVGPIRSARRSDIDILTALNRPLLLWSGANPSVTSIVKQAESVGQLVDRSHTVAAPLYRRLDDRPGPHDLVTDITAIREQYTPADAGPPRGLFSIRPADAPLPDTAVASPGLGADFGNKVRAEYRWSDERGCWERFQDGPFLGGDGQVVCPQNVVFLRIGYTSEGGSPVAQTVGEGTGVVLMEGHAVEVTWRRPDAASRWQLTDAAGDPVQLGPGRTWIELADVAGAPFFPVG